MFNLICVGYKKYLNEKFAWSPYNFKYLEEPHKPLEIVILIREETREIFQIRYIDFNNNFKNEIYENRS